MQRRLRPQPLQRTPVPFVFPSEASPDGNTKVVFKIVAEGSPPVAARPTRVGRRGRDHGPRRAQVPDASRRGRPGPCRVGKGLDPGGGTGGVRPGGRGDRRRCGGNADHAAAGHNADSREIDGLGRR